MFLGCNDRPHANVGRAPQIQTKVGLSSVCLHNNWPVLKADCINCSKAENEALPLYILATCRVLPQSCGSPGTSVSTEVFCVVTMIPTNRRTLLPPSSGLVSYPNTRQCNNAENTSLNLHHGKNLKSLITWPNIKWHVMSLNPLPLSLY